MIARISIFSLLFQIAETHPPYTTDGQYNIYYKKYEGNTLKANHEYAKYLIHINKGAAYTVHVINTKIWWDSPFSKVVSPGTHLSRILVRTLTYISATKFLFLFLC